MKHKPPPTDSANTSAVDTTYTRLRRLTGVLTLGIALFAFVVSFEAIREYAVTAGVPEELAWIIPLLVDTFIVVASLGIWLRSMDGERAWMATGLLVIAAAVSLLINIAHAPSRFSAQAVAAIPPAALIAAFHVAMSELRRSAERRITQVAEQRKAEAARQAEQDQTDAFRTWFEQLAPAERGRVLWQTIEVQGGRQLTGAELYERLDGALTKRRMEQLLKQWRAEQAAADTDDAPIDVDPEIVPSTTGSRTLVTAGDRS